MDRNEKRNTALNLAKKAAETLRETLATMQEDESLHDIISEYIEEFSSVANEEESDEVRNHLLDLAKRTQEEILNNPSLRRAEKSGRKDDVESGGDTDEEPTKGQIIIEALKHKTKKEQMKELIIAGVEKDETLQATDGSERTYNKALKET